MTGVFYDNDLGIVHWHRSLDLESIFNIETEVYHALKTTPRQSLLLCTVAGRDCYIESIIK